MTCDAEKHEVLAEVLSTDWARVGFAPRTSGVVVPAHLRAQVHVNFDIGYGNAAVPIPDLTLDARGFGCTLSFNRMPIRCYIPWTAVEIIQNIRTGTFYAWYETRAPSHTNSITQKPQLRLIRGGKSDQRGSDPDVA